MRTLPTIAVVAMTTTTTFLVESFVHQHQHQHQYKHQQQHRDRARSITIAAATSSSSDDVVDASAPLARSASSAAVLAALDDLYPPSDLHVRNAASRTDGYWAYVRNGEEPPLELTYGEFDAGFLEEVLDRARGHFFCPTSVREFLDDDDDGSSWNDRVFVDVGSGAGRLVLAAAALCPEFRLCRGVEVLPGLHRTAVECAKRCAVVDDDDDDATRFGEETEHRFRTTTTTGRRYALSSNSDSDEAIVVAPIELLRASALDPDECDFGDADCVFVFSSCMNGEILERLSAAIGSGCRPGTVVVTTDYPLTLEGEGYAIRMLESVDGPCDVVGGTTTAHFHRVMESGWEPPSATEGDA